MCFEENIDDRVMLYEMFSTFIVVVYSALLFTILASWVGRPFLKVRSLMTACLSSSWSHLCFDVMPLSWIISVFFSFFLFSSFSPYFYVIFFFLSVMQRSIFLRMSGIIKEQNPRGNRYIQEMIMTTSYFTLMQEFSENSPTDESWERNYSNWGDDGYSEGVPAELFINGKYSKRLLRGLRTWWINYTI